MRLVPAFLVAAPLLLAVAFGPFLDGDFVWDDAHLIEHNPTMRRADGYRAIVSHDLWGEAGGGSTQLYHPLPMLSLWAQAQLSGLRVWPMRLANVLIHALAVALFGLLLRKQGASGPVAAGTALLVLVHPNVTEPVMWLTGRHDLLAVVFVLSGLLLWPRAHDLGDLPSALLSGVSFALAFLCKEPYVVAPALAGAMVITRSTGERRAPSLPEWSALALAGIPLLAAVAVRRTLGISLGASQASEPLLTHARSFAGVVAHYGVLALSFGNGPTIAPYNPLSPAAAASVWVVVCAVTGILVVRLLRGHPSAALACFGWLWFLCALSPHVISVPTIGLFGNRYGYLALFGLAACGAGLWPASWRFSSAPPSALVGVAILALGFAAALRTGGEARHFRSNRTLYGADLERDPRNGYALYHYATAVLSDSGCGAALPLFAHATELAPRYPRPWHDVAGCALSLGDRALGESAARRAVALDPNNAGEHYNLGLALVGRGARVEALRELHVALQLSPGHEATLHLLRGLQGGTQARPTEPAAQPR